MAYEAPVAVYDACVLFPFHLRNLLVQCAVDGLVEARWTNTIHDEWTRTLAARNPSLPIERLRTTRELMNAVLPEALVTNHEPLIADLVLPDLDDRHVLAAAIAAKASVIVSWNLADFPAHALAPYGVACKTPDAFLVELYGASPDALAAVVDRARLNLRATKPAREDFLEALARQGLTELIGVLRDHQDEES
ncbi:MAG: PIN domain-containing protein [Hyphomonadaceae bacterium]